MVRKEIKVWAFLALLTFSAACATSQVQKARAVSADVHALLVSVDDAEEAVYVSGTVPAWDAAKHKAFSGHMVVALKAGLAFNEEVRLAPASPAAKADLATVSSEITELEALASETLGPTSKVVDAIKTVDAAIVKMLPLFLK